MVPGGKIKIHLPPEEARVRAVAEIVQALINGIREGKDIDLNSHKTSTASKYILSRAPKLVEIIAAVPEEYRGILLPQLRAKPVRTASGIAVVAVMSKPHRCPHIATTGNHACNTLQVFFRAYMAPSSCYLFVVLMRAFVYFFWPQGISVYTAPVVRTRTLSTALSRIRAMSPQA